MFVISSPHGIVSASIRANSVRSCILSNNKSNWQIEFHHNFSVFTLICKSISLSEILLFCGFSSADMPLRLVQIQHTPYLFI